MSTRPESLSWLELSAAIKENITKKMEIYLNRSPAEWHKVIIFTDLHHATKWQQIHHSILYTDQPLVPVPDGYDPKFAKNFRNTIRQFAITYFRTRNCNPRCHFHATGDPRNPKVHTVFYDRNSLSVDFSVFPFKVDFKLPSVPPEAVTSSSAQSPHDSVSPCGCEVETPRTPKNVPTVDVYGEEISDDEHWDEWTAQAEDIVGSVAEELPADNTGAPDVKKTRTE